MTKNRSVPLSAAIASLCVWALSPCAITAALQTDAALIQALRSSQAKTVLSDYREAFEQLKSRLQDIIITIKLPHQRRSKIPVIDVTARTQEADTVYTNYLFHSQNLWSLLVKNAWGEGFILGVLLGIVHRVWGGKQLLTTPTKIALVSAALIAALSKQPHYQTVPYFTSALEQSTYGGIMETACFAITTGLSALCALYGTDYLLNQWHSGEDAYQKEMNL